MYSDCQSYSLLPNQLRLATTCCLLPTTSLRPTSYIPPSYPCGHRCCHRLPTSTLLPPYLTSYLPPYYLPPCTTSLPTRLPTSYPTSLPPTTSLPTYLPPTYLPAPTTSHLATYLFDFSTSWPHATRSCLCTCRKETAPNDPHEWQPAAKGPTAPGPFCATNAKGANGSQPLCCLVQGPTAPMYASARLNYERPKP